MSVKLAVGLVDLILAVTAVVHSNCGSLIVVLC